jgi:hypothetical protein
MKTLVRLFILGILTVTVFSAYAYAQVPLSANIQQQGGYVLLPDGSVRWIPPEAALQQAMQQGLLQPNYPPPQTVVVPVPVPVYRRR